jgi:GTP-binding protein Era
MTYRAGFVTLLGRPNVGKSTLLNQLVGKKVSITSSRPQTTRHRLLGIRTGPHAQLVFVDTPGVHDSKKRFINRVMNKTAKNALEGVDITLLMITSKGWTEEDRLALELARQHKHTLILLINKIDRLKDKTRLLPLLEESAGIYAFDEIIPVSATRGENIDNLVEQLIRYLPESPQLFPAEQATDRGDRFIVSEVIREKLFRSLHHELPYALAVEVRQLDITDSLVSVDAIIWVEKDSQKGIIIGRAGHNLKAIGSAARKDLEDYFSRKVFVQLWVKVRENWSDNAGMLKTVGYLEDE